MVRFLPITNNQSPLTNKKTQPPKPKAGDRQHPWIKLRLLSARRSIISAPQAGLLADGSSYSPCLPVCATQTVTLPGFVPVHSGGTAMDSHHLPFSASSIVRGIRPERCPPPVEFSISHCQRFKPEPCYSRSIQASCQANNIECRMGNGE